MHATVAELSRPGPYPAISLLLPVDGDPLDVVRMRLDRLVADAVERLRLELDPEQVERLDVALRRAVDAVEIAHGQEGLAVYVGGRTEIVPLPVPVRERVVVDETFATRDVVRALQRSPRYRVVVLGPRRTRLYDGVGLALTEVEDEAFAAVPSVAADTAGGRGRAAARGRVSRDLRRAPRGNGGVDAFVRALDAALDPHVREDPLPIVLVGSAPRLTGVVGASRHRDLIAGTARGAHDHPDRARLGRHVWPIVEDLLRRRTAEALAELDGVDGRRYASGIREVWLLARQGRGELLLVEEGFEQPARVDLVAGNVEPTADRDAPGVVDDLVDEVIEGVLAARGRVHVVPDGTLAAHDHIAMKLRY
jgi:hypothetical protein